MFLYKLHEKKYTHLTICSLITVLKHATHQDLWASLRNKGTWLILGDNSFDNGHTITNSLRERTWVWSDYIQKLKDKSRNLWRVRSKASGISVRPVEHPKHWHTPIQFVQVSFITNTANQTLTPIREFNYQVQWVLTHHQWGMQLSWCGDLILKQHPHKQPADYGIQPLWSQLNRQRSLNRHCIVKYFL